MAVKRFFLVRNLDIIYAYDYSVMMVDDFFHSFIFLTSYLRIVHTI
jgi:hypothetical protein